MTEQKTEIAKEKKNELKKLNEFKEKKVEESKTEEKEEKKEIKKDEKKSSEKQKVKKYEAVVRSFSLPISKKHSMYISKFIKNKDIDFAIHQLGEVIKMKRAIPFRGEIPHRKGAMMSGRYPVKASKYFIKMLKTLKGNAIVNGMELEKTKIFFSSPSWASRPAIRGGARAKRLNIVLKAKEFSGGKSK